MFRNTTFNGDSLHRSNLINTSFFATRFRSSQPTTRPHKNERSVQPVTISMVSGDAIYFDGGAVPHEDSRINKNATPEFYRKNPPPGCIARISVLFREPC